MASNDNASAHGISRRRVMQGAAWATPAVIIATAVPAFANGSGTTAPAVITTSYSGAAAGGTVTATRVDNGSQYSLLTVTIVITVNKIPGNGGSNNQYFDVTASASGWNVAVNNNLEGRAQAKLSTTASITLTRTITLDNTDGIGLTWTTTNVASVVSAVARATYGIAPSTTVGTTADFPIYP